LRLAVQEAVLAAADFVFIKSNVGKRRAASPRHGPVATRPALVPCGNFTSPTDKLAEFSR